MTKKEIVRELHSNGELWANESYSKQYLADYLDRLNDARSMSDEELLAHIMKGKGVS